MWARSTVKEYTLEEGNMSDGTGIEHELVDLTLRFDRRFARIHKDKDPDRFQEDPRNTGRPDPNSEGPHRPIKDWRVVAELIRRGNYNYAGFIEACRMAVGKPAKNREVVTPKEQSYLFLSEREVAREEGGEGTTKQDPYAAVLSCIDSRVPVELVTGQASDDVFVIRSAGNILTDLGEASGSMHYILDNYGLGSPNPDGHNTVSTVLVLGHTRCGAVDAAFNAFKLGGAGTVGLPPSLAAILYEIKWSVDFVLSHCMLKNDEEKKKAICMVNAAHSHLKVKRMVARIPASVEVLYGTYSVDDFFLHKTSIPGYPHQKFPQVLAERDSSTSFAWTRQGPELDDAARTALAEDAVEFATKGGR
jgi:carbonic anhydrase